MLLPPSSKSIGDGGGLGLGCPAPAVAPGAPRIALGFRCSEFTWYVRPLRLFTVSIQPGKGQGNLGCPAGARFAPAGMVWVWHASPRYRA